MRYLYAAFLIMFSSLYAFSGGNVTDIGKDDDDKGGYGYGRDDDDRGYGKDDDDDDRGGGGYGNDDDDDSGGGKNSFEVQANSGLNFTISQPSHFENKQTIFNALKIKFKTKSSNCSVYAKVINYNTPRDAPQDIPLELEHRNNNSKDVYGLAYKVHLSQYDQRLFVQKKDNRNFNFFYDLNLLPLGYDYPEGQYNFTILFTMTQP